MDHKVGGCGGKITGGDEICDGLGGGGLMFVSCGVMVKGWE